MESETWGLRVELASEELELQRLALVKARMEASAPMGSQRLDEIRCEPLLRISLSRMEYIDIHYCHLQLL